MKKFIPIIVIVALIIGAVMFFKYRKKKQAEFIASSNGDDDTQQKAQTQEQSIFDQINPFKDSAGNFSNPFPELAESLGINLGSSGGGASAPAPKPTPTAPKLATNPIAQSVSASNGSNTVKIGNVEVKNPFPNVLNPKQPKPIVLPGIIPKVAQTKPKVQALPKAEALPKTIVVPKVMGNNPFIKIPKVSVKASNGVLPKTVKKCSTFDKLRKVC